MSLLAHRGAGRRRKPSPLQTFFQSVRATFAGLTGGGDLVGGRGAGRGASRDRTAGLAVVATALLCVAIGYALGSAFPWGGRVPDQSGLRVGASGDPSGQPGFEPGVGRTQGIAPGPIGERQDLQPLASRFFLTAAYRDYEPASAAAQRLRDQGLSTARPRQMDLLGETLFGLVVYFDGDDAGERVREALFAVTAPDATFASYRNQQAGWPNEGALQ